MTQVEKQKRADEIARRLKLEFPKPETPLTHRNAFELLVAVVLSAQATDVSVNLVTPELFKRYKTIADYADADLGELTQLVAKINFYRNKAKNIHKAAQMIMSDFGGKVPDTMEELIKLPGVGRKSANVILGGWFGKNEGFVVDTHVLRTAYRTRLSDSKDPVEVEQDLMKLFPQPEWREMSLRLIFHGRTTCPARRKADTPCSLGELCDRL